MYGTGGVGRWFLGFVLWFAGWSVFLGWILGMKGRGVLIALIAAGIIDSIFSLIFHFGDGEFGLGGFARWLIGCIIWFAVLAVFICWLAGRGASGLVPSLIAAVIIDSIFALFFNLSSGGSSIPSGYSSSSYPGYDSSPVNESSCFDNSAELQRRQAEQEWQEQQRRKEALLEQARMEESIRQQHINDAMAAKYYGNEEAARIHWNEASELLRLIEVGASCFAHHCVPSL